MNKRRSTLIALALSVALLPVLASGQELKKIPLKVGGPRSAAFTNAWSAQQRGIFAKNGLDVSIVYFNNGGDAISAMQGGSVDVAETIPGFAMSAIGRGFDMAVIMQDEISYAKGPDSCSVEVSENSPIKTIADLRGKRVGVGAAGSQSAIALRMILDKAGVDLKTVSFNEVPFPAMLGALKAGHIDAVVAINPFTTQISKQGGRVISWCYVEAIPDMPVGAWFSKGSFIKANPHTVAAFVKSMKESDDWLNADADRARAEVAAFTKLDVALLKDMPIIRWNYHVKLSKWQEVVDMLVKYGSLDPHKAETYFSPMMKDDITP